MKNTIALRFRAPIILLLTSFTCLGQDRPVIAAGFDPAPVEIPSVWPSARRPMTSKDLLSMRDFYGVSISPDGKTVAFVVGQPIYETNSYRSGLFVVGTEPGGNLLCLGSAGPPNWTHLGEWEPEAPQWSADSRFIMRRMKAHGSWQVFRWKRDGGKARQVTHVRSDVTAFQWSADGSSILFTVAKRRDPIAARSLKEHGILYDGSLEPWLMRPVVDQKLEQHPEETEDWVHDMKSGAERRAVPSDRKEPEGWKEKLGGEVFDRQGLKAAGKTGNIINPKLSPDGKKAIYQWWMNDAAKSDRLSFPLYIKTLDGGPAVRLTDAFWVEDYWWSPNSQEVFYLESGGKGRSPVLFVASANSGEPRRLTNTRDGEWADQFSLDRSASLAACVHQTNTTPPELALVDLKTGSLRTLVKISPEFQNLELSSPERIEWTNKYGYPGFAYLVKPLGFQEGKRYPLVVTLYRSGDYFLRGGVGDEYPIQVLAANGFAVLSFDAGEPPNYKPGDFDKVLLRWSSPLASLEEALRILDERGIADSGRRGLTGVSYGVEILSFVISHSNLFQAASGSALGGFDPFFYYMAPTGWRATLQEWGLNGLPDGKSSPRWKELSAALNADRIHAPLLANVADTEYLVGLQLYTRLQEMGKPVELFIYPNELHIKYQPKHRNEIYERNIDWFKFWLQDYEDANPAKAEQYKRWHELRRLQSEFDQQRTN
jgi:dipeptidyl aminopeptidase/acylaminoacyl peptidase